MGDSGATGSRKTKLRDRFLVAVSISVALIIFEVGLRLWFYGGIVRPPTQESLVVPHPTRGWVLGPGLRSHEYGWDYSVSTIINSRGLRDVEHEVEPMPGTLRVALLGDSFMQAPDIELERSFPRLLEHRLKDRKAEVINFGVIAYGTAQEFFTLKEEALKYKPKVVLAFYCGNDIRENSERLEELIFGPGIRTFGRPYARPVDGEPYDLSFTMPDQEKVKAYRTQKQISGKFSLRNLAYSSVAFERIYSAVRSRTVEAGAPEYDPNVFPGWPILDGFDASAARKSLTESEYDRLWHDAWLVTKRLIAATRDLAQTNGAQFVLFTVPMKMQVDDDLRRKVEQLHPNLKFDMDKINRELGRFCRDEGLRCLDLLPAFRKAYEEGRRPLYHRFDDHWNTRGHEFAAELVADYLQKEIFRPTASSSGKGASQVEVTPRTGDR
ncbi:MAG: GDSL-type esterase/lipase family protein [Desulfomonile sp.]|nr:GDSL-type esterase/lipase family protein [Desulfomonile sp.]